MGRVQEEEVTMQVIRDRQGYSEAERPTAVAMGFFDGVHLGHQAVIAAMVQHAQAHNLVPAVFTFSLSAADTGVQKAAAGRIMMDEQKHEALAALGVSVCFEPPFASFSALGPADFFNEMLRGNYHAAALFCGENFHFGNRRAGDTEQLRQLCAQSGVHLSVVPTTLWQGGPVSSSRIRAALQTGDIPAVNAMLGRPYEICFPVRHGRRLGRTLGFPTLNQMFPEDMQAPAHGVYITQTVVDGTVYPSATGFGPQPTVGGATPTCETFIPNFSGDLYGKYIRVRFFKQLSPIRRFESPEALADAVQGWARDALAYFV